MTTHPKDVPVISRSLVAALILSAGLVLAAPLAASAQTVDDTTDITSALGEFGPVGVATPTYGESVVAPATDTVLTSFAFRIQGDPTTIFRGQIYPWNGTTISGPALYTSDARTLAGDGVDFETVTFSTGGTQLVAGQSYMLLATTLLDPQTATQSQNWQFGTTTVVDPATAGNWSNLESVSEMTTLPWDHTGGEEDFAYRAVYETPLVISGITPATAPSTGGTTVTINGTGFLGAVGVDFGSVAATSFVVNSDTTITATVPAQTVGDVNVTIEGNGFSSAAVPASTFSYTAPVVVVAAAAVSAVPLLAATGSANALPMGLLAATLLATGTVLLSVRRFRRTQ
jgi:hypothetical protein